MVWSSNSKLTKRPLYCILDCILNSLFITTKYLPWCKSTIDLNIEAQLEVLNVQSDAHPAVGCSQANVRGGTTWSSAFGSHSLTHSSDAPPSLSVELDS